MTDNFNMKQFLMENKLGAYSKMKNEGEAAYEYEKGKEAGEQEEKEELQEREVIYVWGDDGGCYRKDDEGNYDKVDDGYCKRYAEGKEEETETLSEREVIYVWNDGRCFRKDDEGNYDEVPDTYCKRYAESVNEEKVEEASSEATERMDGLVSQMALKALTGGAQAIIRDLKADGFDEEDIFDFIMSKIKTL